MRKILKFSSFLLAASLVLSCTGKGYETIENDPTATRIYVLDNGLKVYLSVNKDEPRVEAHIAVRVGGKNDPHETTGLAHYFEHLMFKGTESYGTQNYRQEKPLLDQIEAAFEQYRKMTGEAERKAQYRLIDSLSYEASKIAIPNEYDKLMAAIGANGTNAYTGYDMTVYTENIPSNQIENWAKIQADRFKHSVIRGFHTELETVYEEKNMSLTNDFRKVMDCGLSVLFKNHPYGTQTILGTQQHLKNPSITNIKKYYKEWYVPNNIAICMAGDFDPEQVMEIIRKYFGDLQPNPDLKRLEFQPESPIEEPVVKEVYGLESPLVALAWRLPGPKDPDYLTMSLLSQILYNGQAGLMDLNVNQQQKLLSAFAGTSELADYSVMLMVGEPKKDQTPEDVRNILLTEMEKIRKGEFDESLLEAIANNYKLTSQQTLEDNEGRVNVFVNCFVNDISLEDYFSVLERINQVTKEDIMAYADKYLKATNYVQINKLQGKDPDENKIDKPQITPIFMNRDTSSAFLRAVQNTAVPPVEPVFVDFRKDMSILKAQSDIEVLYKQNQTNDLFSLIYLFEMGENQDRALALAAQYLDYLGTSSLTPEQVKQQFYALACSFSVSAGPDRTYVILSGLNENMTAAMKLFESLLADAKANPGALVEMKNMILQERDNSKHNQSSNFSALQRYAMYGKHNPQTDLLPEKELMALTDEALLEKIKGLSGLEHRILYYGPLTGEALLKVLAEEHRVAEKLEPVDRTVRYKKQLTEDNRILFAPYDAKQIYFLGYSNRGEQFDPELQPLATLYNIYFGGGMNSIVFQEMRESRGLAYSAGAGLSIPSTLKDGSYAFTSFIATQNDKMIDAMNAFEEIINDMPLSEHAFNIAKESAIANLRTLRTIKESVLWYYLNMQELGLDYDLNKLVFEKIQGYTLQDVVDFQKKWVKDRKYTFCILGDEKSLDMKGLRKFGKIEKLKTEEIFGY